MATPEENAYIEAFHSIEQCELIDRHHFSNFYDAKQHIEKYMHWYNFKRKHGAISFMTPMQEWAQGISLSTVRPPMKQGATGLSKPDSMGMSGASALYSLDKTGEPAYLCLTSDNDSEQTVAGKEPTDRYVGANR